jgi:tRNA pseudouridine synthase 10
MSQLEYFNQRIESEVIHAYQFETFSIGISLPHEIFDREDLIRARYKIRGKESIKSQLQNELRERFQASSRKKLCFHEPDLSIGVILSRQGEVKIQANSKSITFTGRYIKKQRGLPQRRRLCKQCDGNGCENCNYCGHHDRSIEAIIATEMLHLTKGRAPKFSWVGSEDSNSLVSGKGRPFFVRISDPKVRSIRGGIIVDTNEVEVVIDTERKRIPRSPVRFITRAKVFVESSSIFDFHRLENFNKMNSSIVRFQNKSKMTSKRIYSIEVSQASNESFELDMLVEGGFIIKKFVSGYDNTVPSVSQIVGTRCETKVFDIFEVIEHNKL